MTEPTPARRTAEEAREVAIATAIEFAREVRTVTDEKRRRERVVFASCLGFPTEVAERLERAFVSRSEREEGDAIDGDLFILREPIGRVVPYHVRHAALEIVQHLSPHFFAVDGEGQQEGILQDSDHVHGLTRVQRLARALALGLVVVAHWILLRLKVRP